MPHLGAWSCLINNENSNSHRKPEMGIVFTSEWKVNMNELAQKNKEDFG
jgi:hypothetical protein